MPKAIKPPRSRVVAAGEGVDMEHLNFVLPSSMKRQLEERAADQVMSTSHLLRQLVRMYLKSGASRSAFSPSTTGNAVAGGSQRP